MQYLLTKEEYEALSQGKDAVDDKVKRAVGEKLKDFQAVLSTRLAVNLKGSPNQFKAQILADTVKVTVDEFIGLCITCPKCNRTSYNSEDVRQKYCSVCGFHEFQNRES